MPHPTSPVAPPVGYGTGVQVATEYAVAQQGGGSNVYAAVVQGQLASVHGALQVRVTQARVLATSTHARILPEPESLRPRKVDHGLQWRQNGIACCYGGLASPRSVVRPSHAHVHTRQSAGCTHGSQHLLIAGRRVTTSPFGHA